MMKTISITVDDETLELIDELQSSSTRFRSRSALVRAAIRELSTKLLERLGADRERENLRQNKTLLNEQLEALVEQQRR